MIVPTAPEAKSIMPEREWVLPQLFFDHSVLYGYHSFCESHLRGGCHTPELPIRLISAVR